MIKVLTFLSVVCLNVFPTTAYSQEWSYDQKKVWTNVVTYWDLSSKGDIEGFLGYFHKDFSGWDNAQALPDDLAARTKANRYDNSNRKWLFHALKPLSIKIHGGIAIVQYSYTSVTKYKEEEEKSEQGRWTDILMRKGKKWIMIGDHGGATPED
ncbi:MAG TPA: DUF4440 domain-containing protein [candidate division Zixibacteria bacterium]|jgi:hypothetical protein|nr:DUF4440 domain-containing protein [candidate division Zixibacteria bacterium]